MDSLSPSTISSCTSPESTQGYPPLPQNPEIEGRTIRLVPLSPSHIDGLWQSFNDADNIKLFAQWYGDVICKTKDSLWKALTAHKERHEGSRTLTILDKPTSRVLGWTELHTTSANPDRTFDSDPGTVHAALFLPRPSRSERGTETIHHLGRLIFNELEYATLAFRAGKLDESCGPRGGPMGITLIGVLSRQLRDDRRSGVSDLHVLPRARWPDVYAAVRAWLDSREGGEGVGRALEGWGVVGF